MPAFTPFNRSEMLPPSPPPKNQRGILRWAHKNLFSSVFNTLLTVVAIVLVGRLIFGALPWWLNSVWSANSLQECRDIVAAAGAKTGACWAVIRARWHQYLFGFYPPDQYWRAVLCLGLLLVALTPILLWSQNRKREILIAGVGLAILLAMALLQTPWAIIAISAVLFLIALGVSYFMPSRLIWLSALYPFFAIWLLWGGSAWKPIVQIVAILLGIWIARLYWNRKNTALNLAFATLLAICGAYLGGMIIGYANTISSDFLNRLNNQSFWPVFATEGSTLNALFTGGLALILWLFTCLIWLLLAVMRGVSAVLNLGLGHIFNFPYAQYCNLGAALTFVALFNAAKSRSPMIGLLGGILSSGAFYFALSVPIIATLSGVISLDLTPVSSDRFGGFLLALVIGVSAITASLPLGILLALGRQSHLFLIHSLSVGFIEFIRGVPLITLLFTASLLLQYFLPPQTNFDLILRVIILASLFASAYLAEVIRGGLAALSHGQYEASDALGLTYWQMQRLIIMPQALKVSIPGIVSTFIGLFKDTTLVSFVGLLDPLRGVTMSVRADINWKGIYWEPYIFVAALFFVICFSMSRYSMYLERKLKTDHR